MWLALTISVLLYVLASLWWLYVLRRLNRRIPLWLGLAWSIGGIALVFNILESLEIIDLR